MGAITRKDLYEEVWADPVSEVAKRYSLSDVGLAKLCRTMGIPLPPRGCWAKVRSGEGVKRASLPKAGSFREVVMLTRYEPAQVEARIQAKERVKKVKLAVDSANQQSKQVEQHPLVVATRKHLSHHVVATEKGLLSAPDKGLDLEVTKGSLERALLLVNALVMGLGKQGARVEVNAEKKSTLLVFEHATIELKITEKVRRRDHVETPEETKAKERYWRNPHARVVEYPNMPRYDYLPTGSLAISAGRWPSRGWADTDRRRLESRLPEVIAGIVGLSFEIRDREAEEARKEEARRIAREEYEAAIKARKEEREAFEQLERNAQSWERASRLRSYLQSVESNAKLSGDMSKDVIEWLAWAHAKADWLDPLISVSDPILDAPEPKSPGWYIDFEEE